MATHTLVEELSSHSTIPGTSQSTYVTCALCGTSILDSNAMSRPSHPPSPTRAGSGGKAGWNASFLKSSLVQTISATPFGNALSRSSSVPALIEAPSQVYIFRLEATASSGLPVSLPLQSQQPGTPTRTATIYPLCASGWCLYRLRTTCSLWAFIRTGVVEKVWDEDSFMPPSRTNSPRIGGNDTSGVHSGESRSGLSGKKSRIGIGALWGTMQRSLSNNSPRPEPESPMSREEQTKELPKAPIPSSPRRLPPPPPPRHPPIAAPIAVHPPSGPPPPLPKRNRHRTDSPAPTTVEEHATSMHDGSAPQDGSNDGALPTSPPEEEFTTPVEEIAPPSFARPMTPSAIPLPPSLPGTPVPPASPAPQNMSRITTPPPPPPRRREDAPQRTASPSSPAPPPLPRRAAARARPSSLNVVSVMPPPSVTIVTPENPGDDVEVETKEHPEVPPKGDVASTEKGGTAEQPARALEAEEPKESPEVMHAIPKLDTKHNNASKSSESLPSSEHSSLGTAVLVSPEGLGDDDDSHHVGEVGPESMLHASTEALELDMSLHVGAATWEERTWRELVKLREEMFWARLGGSR